MNIGICGGTFDPFHRGHLDPVLAIREDMQWDRVIYIPAWKQPFKTDRESASGYHRFSMAILATQNYESLFVSPIELERGGTSYTVDTLEMLHSMYAGATFDWIVGDDAATQLTLRGARSRGACSCARAGEARRSRAHHLRPE